MQANYDISENIDSFEDQIQDKVVNSTPLVRHVPIVPINTVHGTVCT